MGKMLYIHYPTIHLNASYVDTFSNTASETQYASRPGAVRAEALCYGMKMRTQIKKST